MQRVAIVTGAGSGLGKAASARLAADGFHVLCVDRSGTSEEQASVLREAGQAADAIIADLADTDLANGLIEEAVRRHGRIDLLLNNAGTGISRGDRPATLEEITLDEWTGILAVNLTAPFLLARAVIPHMRRTGWGRIVNVSSRAGRTGIAAAEASYSASKAGLIGLTRYLAMAVGDGGITVNAIAPGRFGTPLANNVSAELLAGAMAGIPLGRIGDPQEFAATVGFLASDGAAYITGAVIDVNGGAFMG